MEPSLFGMRRDLGGGLCKAIGQDRGRGQRHQDRSRPRCSKTGPGSPDQRQAAATRSNSAPASSNSPPRCRATSSDVTIRGQGIDKTILTFNQQGQGTGGEGLLITSKKNFTIEDLAVEDAKGDAIKVNGCDGVTFRKVRVSWTGGPKETNGAYGLYPVLSQERADRGLHGRWTPRTPASTSASRRTSSCAAIGPRTTWPASRSKTRSTPTSMRTSPRTTPAASWCSRCPTCRRRSATTAASTTTRSSTTTTKTSPPKGTTVAGVPAGTGVMIMANRHVEVFENTIENNQTVSLVDHQLPGHRQALSAGPECTIRTAKRSTCTTTSSSAAATSRAADLGELLMAVTADRQLPDIVYDGIVDPKKAVDGKLPAESGHPHRRTTATPTS